jgi:hypothetical protein
VVRGLGLWVELFFQAWCVGDALAGYISIGKNRPPGDSVRLAEANAVEAARVVKDAVVARRTLDASGATASNAIIARCLSNRGTVDSSKLRTD